MQVASGPDESRQSDQQASVESRIERLERAVVVQTRLLDHLWRALSAHQAVIEGLARRAGMEIECESVQAASFDVVN
jgi:uncharacterized coiled-coil protein SlyX